MNVNDIAPAKLARDGDGGYVSADGRFRIEAVPARGYVRLGKWVKGSKSWRVVDVTGAVPFNGEAAVDATTLTIARQWVTAANC